MQDVSLERRRAIAFKIETNEGVAEVLGAADVIPCRNIVWKPSVPNIEKSHHSDTLSNEAPVPGRRSAGVSFECLLYGGSAAGTPSFIGKLLRACRNAETIVGGTSSQYLPATIGLKSATLKAFIDGISHQLVGVRGNADLSFPSGEVPILSFDFMGIWDPVTDADATKDEALLVGSALPSFDPKSFKAALLSVDGSYKLIAKAFKFGFGNKLVMVPDANVTPYKRILINSVDPAGEVDTQMVTRVTKDFPALLHNKTKFQLRAFAGSEDSGSFIGLKDLTIDDTREGFEISGTGVGTLNTLTDSSKTWTTNQWAGFRVRDAVGTYFYISANTGTALTVVGTPVSGAYVISKPIGDTGTGTGSLNTMTDGTKAWVVSRWVNYRVMDSAGAIFVITANTATTLTVAGTPASGAYTIYKPAYDTGTGTGTSNTLTDGTKDWTSNQWVGYRVKDAAGTIFEITGNGATTLTVVGTPATGAYTIYLPSKNWTVNQWANYKLLDSAGATFTITANTSTTLVVSGRPATGDYVIYEAGKLWRITLPKVTLNELSDQKEDGVNKYGMSFKINKNAGDDEWELLNL